ncbi:hypothetical protein GQ53DRAFT_817498 [Thozetella sp. PMI_491]|nr:hypothetical protein GQ53DRAFT_817498 [Thozetella sp. PMI_491]
MTTALVQGGNGRSPLEPSSESLPLGTRACLSKVHGDDIRQGIPSYESIRELRKLWSKIRRKKGEKRDIEAALRPAEPRARPVSNQFNVIAASKALAFALPEIKAESRTKGQEESDVSKKDSGVSGISIEDEVIEAIAESSSTAVSRRPHQSIAILESVDGPGAFVQVPQELPAHTPAPEVASVLMVPAPGSVAAGKRPEIIPPDPTLSYLPGLPESSSYPTQTLTPSLSVPPPTRAAPAIPVHIPLSKLERVRTLRFVPLKTVMAREIALSPSDEERLKRFSCFVCPANQEAIFKRTLPQCHRYLVEITEPGRHPQVYICIDGLVEDDDIKVFHEAMSERSCRKYYEPWKICFKRIGISAAAANEYRINIDPDETTLCGALVCTHEDGRDWVSTIGGIIQCGDDLCALTTAHPPSAEASGSRSPSSVSNLNADNLPDDATEALVLTVDDPPQVEIEDETRCRERSDFKDFVGSFTPIASEKDDDWCLIPVPEQYQLPNHVQKSPKGGLEDRQTSLRYITEWTSAVSSVRVLVRAGRSGNHLGTVSLSPSYLDGVSGTRKVWTVHLDTTGAEILSHSTRPKEH